MERLRHELQHAHGTLATARTTVQEREQDLEELRHATRAELQQAHDALAAAHASAEEAAQTNDDEQAGRQELERLHAELEHARATLASAQTAVQEREQDLQELRARLEQVEGAAAAAQATAGEEDRSRDELRAQLDRRHAQAARLTARLLRLRRLDDEQLSQIERLVADVRGCDEEIARLRQENEEASRGLGERQARARAQTRRFLERLRRREHELAELAALVTQRDEPAPAPAPEIASHLVFVELPDRYELVERAGPPPPRNSAFEVPGRDRPLVVLGARRSPLPDDARPCVVAQPAAAVAEE